MPRRTSGALHVATTKRTCKGKVYVTYLLRRSYREGGKVKHQTLGNLSHLPEDVIELIRRRLRGEPVGCWQIVRSLPHGHVAAVLGVMRQIGMDRLLASRRCRRRDAVLAMIAARILEPGSKLATARGLRSQTASCTLGLELGLEGTDEDVLYEAMDWLVERQHRIERKLAKRHLQDGTLVLYDVSSSYYTGRCHGLVQFGYSRDGRKGLPQVTYGLLCNAEGCPIAVEVFSGNTADPKTLGSQIQKIRGRFRLQRVVLVGDRGMITSKRIDEDLREAEGLDWITALRGDSIQKLMRQGTIQPSLFDERDLAEVQSPDYPGERLIVCRNPFLAQERRAKRESLLAATEKLLDAIVAATRREKRPLRGKLKIQRRVDRVIDRYKVGKHFKLQITDESFSYCRDEERIAAEAALDGLYVIRTSVGREELESDQVVRAYKDLSKVERAFRCLKTVDLKVRPIYHWVDRRIRAHVFLCMLAYYVEWHMRQRLRPILFDDHQREAAEALRPSVVSPAPRSEAARRKDFTRQTEDGSPVHSFRSLLRDLATLTKNRVRVAETGAEFYVLAQATPSQRRALDLLGVSL